MAELPAMRRSSSSIRNLNARGLDVTFYPFILMTQLVGNARPDPFGRGEQPKLPWRGRITTSIAPEIDPGVDRSIVADQEVDRFFGTARAADFRVLDGAVSYSGPNEWSYRRFILHYAALCAASGGVEAFCIGSEMRGLTQIRGSADQFPAVAQMVRLAQEVRQLLPSAKLGYAADWSEYFGYRPADTGNVHFHLDPLWASPAIDFVGIDNYMPLSDWRDGDGHVDVASGSIYDIPYLMENIEGGEGFDWYYRSEAARDVQDRDAITDGAHGEPWVFRYKDIRSWWNNRHHDRIDGVRSQTPTAWVPRSKPFRLTEYGCAALDKGANQPNRFLDPKSSESGVPYYSNGQRDDAMQMQYLRAITAYWNDPAINIFSELYGGPMLDMDHSFAWAWDARPWPAFPDLQDFWSDGVNHARGHWLSGRSANQPLASVIREICASADLHDIDVSKVYGVVRGYDIREIRTARSELQALMLAYGVEATEHAGRVVFSMRANAREWMFGNDMLARTDDAVVAIQRAPDPEVSGRVRVHYVSAAGDFSVRVGEAVHPGQDQIPVSDTELPLALTSGEGSGLAERFLAEARTARETLQTALPASCLDVRAGDHLRLEGSPDSWRIDRIEDAGARVVHAVRVEKSVFEARDEAEDRAISARPATALPADVVFLDLPFLTGNEDPYSPHVAAAARPWPGSIAVHSSVTGSNYRLNTFVETPSSLGWTETPLAGAAPGIWDDGPELLIRLNEAGLASVSDEALFAGANAMAIGDGSASGWEILQFRDVRLVGPDLWAVSRRLRGQRGTEPNMRAEWAVGSRVVMLDGSLEQLDLPPDAIGLPRHFRTGPARLPLDHPSYVHEIATFHAEALRPYRPVHLRAFRTDTGVQGRWTRRSRAVGENWDVPDVPLAETFEAYVVRLLSDDGTVLTERQVASSEVLFTQEFVDGLAGGGSPVRMDVAQLSDTFGPGHRASTAIA